jgi:hypothetical protein
MELDYKNSLEMPLVGTVLLGTMARVPERHSMVYERKWKR